MSKEPLQKIEGEFTQRASAEQGADDILRRYAAANIQRTGAQWNYHSLVTIKRQVLSRILYVNELYQKIVNVPGVICEFGVHWGATFATLMNLRGMYEPYNYSRRLYGFDTFSGFTSVDEKDGGLSNKGDYSTSAGYEAELEEILAAHESLSPISHMRRFELIKGDVTQTLPNWLERNPQAIISMALFDMDVYTPTKFTLEAILPRLINGSVLVFDELNCPYFPGETRAVDEVLGLKNLKLKRFPHQPYCAWAVYGD